MEYIAIGIVIAIAIAGIIIYTKVKKREDIPTVDLESMPSTVFNGESEPAGINQENELII